MKRCIVERTTKEEIRREEQSEKAESCQENFWNEIQSKAKPAMKKMKKLHRGTIVKATN